MDGARRGNQLADLTSQRGAVARTPMSMLGQQSLYPARPKRAICLWSQRRPAGERGQWEICVKLCRMTINPLAHGMGQAEILLSCRSRQENVPRAKLSIDPNCVSLGGLAWLWVASTVLSNAHSSSRCKCGKIRRRGPVWLDTPAGRAKPTG